VTHRLRTLLLSLSVALIVPATASTPAATGFSAKAMPPLPTSPVASVVVISVDGLTPLALDTLGADGTPHLHEFMAKGASTLNARTQVEMTVTLPNHTGMVTGRRIKASKGGHGVTWNDDRRRPPTVQAAARGPVESVFSTLHQAGRSSAVFANKTKFSLWKRSWPHGIHRNVIRLDQRVVVDRAIGDLRNNQRSLRFVHIGLPDAAAHASGFMSPRYLQAVRRSDRLVGRIVKAVQSDPALSASTAIVLTADHGGIPGTKRHGDAKKVANYRIPFMVRGPGIPEGADLYALNPDYADPRDRRVGYGATRQPIRNTAVANLVLDLLGLGPVPGSQLNQAQDLDVNQTDAN
jgi:hypothetical protein